MLGKTRSFVTGLVIIGGLAASTLLNLPVLPPLCLLVAGWRRSARSAPCA